MTGRGRSRRPDAPPLGHSGQAPPEERPGSPRARRPGPGSRTPRLRPILRATPRRADPRYPCPLGWTRAPSSLPAARATGGSSGSRRGLRAPEDGARPAGCSPLRTMTSRVLPRDLGPREFWALGQPKVGKVAGSQRPGSGAHGEVGTQAGTSRSPLPPARSAPQCRPPALQGPGLAARPRGRCGGGRRAGWPAAVRLSGPPRGSTAPGAAGGAGRGGAGRSAAAPGAQLRPPPSSGPQPGSRRRAPRSARPRAALVRGLDRRTDGWTEREAAPPRPAAQSPCAPRGPGGTRSAPRAPHLRAPRGWSAATPRDPGRLLGGPAALAAASPKSRPKRRCTFAGIFLGVSRPQLVSKQSAKERRAHVPRAPTARRLETRARSRTRLFPGLWSSTYRVSRGGGHVHRVQGDPAGPPS